MGTDELAGQGRGGGQDPGGEPLSGQFPQQPGVAGSLGQIPPLHVACLEGVERHLPPDLRSLLKTPLGVRAQDALQLHPKGRLPWRRQKILRHRRVDDGRQVVEAFAQEGGHRDAFPELQGGRAPGGAI